MAIYSDMGKVRRSEWLKTAARHMLWVGAIICFALMSACAGPRYKIDKDPPVATGGTYHSGTLRPYTIRGKTYKPSIPDKGDSWVGTASWYGSESPNSTTANGEYFNPDAISAAHKTLPLPSIVEVKNLDTGKSMVLRVNDRGPFIDGRLIDLSKGAARELGVLGPGIAKVKVTFLGPAGRNASNSSIARRNDEERYLVLLGSFAVRENAYRAKECLDQVSIERKDGLYVVSMGPFDGADKAEHARQKALSEGFFDAALRRE
ncbi:septal ring lytic transglycosylase RlpA family protein [Asticcacaulis machinosus]|uniref:Endolytic peptidoglycan transglycosylase RlpA n=1 Tax=Asticcacaulis machinosus TaxID=2984211 RepID=A0ABT5HFE7_9CAUL|nr:septal ring lytic transglycosylase RlpA family protein [Asticcacaulis machinosus]MDC7674860.1 septal ring lytic transglycosylase RlpA family protein [Asticcacaulis machinosus]